ncbi:DUF4232 domain-containing protein [Streptomyces sp. NPDC059063]|uniref:DUF4232 domain-containing protein n=1 Tax=unclassified Streptomyces TaxID=2593676 RepID=UPI00367736B3
MRITTRATATAAVLTLAGAALTAAVTGGVAQAAAPTKACTPATTKVTVKKVSSPINHLLLTAKNTSTKTCAAYGAPYLRFDASQSPVQAVKDSKPQALVTLKPGQTAYAGILTESPEGGHGYKSKNLGVQFSNRAMNGSTGPEKMLKLPGTGVYVNSAAAVTYWQRNAADALSW